MLALALPLTLLAAAPARVTCHPTRLDLVGDVAGASTVMHLTEGCGEPPNAFYSYDSGTGVIYLRSKVPLGEDGAIRLHAEDNDSAVKPESFEGKLDLRAGTFHGTWRQGKRSAPFSLRVAAQHRSVARGCVNLEVLDFKLPDPSTSAALAKAVDAEVTKLARDTHCDDGDPESVEASVTGMASGFVSVMVVAGDGTSKGTGQTGLVFDARKLPLRPLALAKLVPIAKANTLANAFARKHHATEDLSEGQAFVDAQTPWAISPAGIVLFLYMPPMLASGDGSVHALLRWSDLGVRGPEDLVH